MPETRAERLILVLGLLLVAGLLFLAVRERRDSPGTAASTTTAAAAATTAAPVATTAAAPAAPAKRAARTGPKASSVRLSISARADAWLELRAGSGTGRVLFSGLLTAGKRTRVAAKRIWARFGAAGNLAVVLDGHPLAMPFGTYEGVFDRRGFRRSGG